MITGQVFMREAGERDGRKLFMVIGILAAPEGQGWIGEQQYDVLAFNNLQLTVTNPHDPAVDTRGLGADGLLTSPMWRV